MCFELREKQSIICLTIPCEFWSCEILLNERQKLASKLCKGKSKNESAKQALEQVSTSCILIVQYCAKGSALQCSSWKSALVLLEDVIYC